MLKKKFSGLTGKSFLWVFGSSLLLGCTAFADNSDQNPAWQPAPWLTTGDAELFSQRHLPGSEMSVKALGPDGLQVQQTEGEISAAISGYFEVLDVRPNRRLDPSSWLVAAPDTYAQTITLAEISRDGSIEERQLPTRDFAVAGSCLYSSDTGKRFLFVVGEEGHGEQWYVADEAGLLSKPLLVRSLPLPPQAEYCQVDDRHQALLVNEEAVGVWSYPADPEALTERTPVAMVKPFGDIAETAGTLLLADGSLLVIDPDAGELHRYTNESGDWQAAAVESLAPMTEAEQAIFVSYEGSEQIAVRDDDSGAWYATPRNAILPERVEDTGNIDVIAEVEPLVETHPVGRHGDAADDPAIWIIDANAKDEKKRAVILGTNKKAGLQVYDLNGQLLQNLEVGRLNNVDLRTGISGLGKVTALAAASNRDHNSISLFQLDESTRTVVPAGEITTDLSDIYGLCMSASKEGGVYIFANDKDGRLQQYRVTSTDDQNNMLLAGERVREVKFDSQPEGCVADDSRGQLFVGEEDVGIWTLSADPESTAEPTMVMKVGGVLHDDVEGLGIYRRNADSKPLLVISSQGNSSYLVADAFPPYTLRTRFRVGINSDLAIDGAAETDGLEVTGINLGGPWSKGMLVVQDGRNRMPEATQNFKLVPWSAIEELISASESE